MAGVGPVSGRRASRRIAAGMDHLSISRADGSGNRTLVFVAAMVAGIHLVHPSDHVVPGSIPVARATKMVAKRIRCDRLHSDACRCVVCASESL